MDGRVVKLNTLADTDGACAQNDDFLLVGQAGGVLTGVGGVEIGNICAGMAGIHHLECGEHLLLFTQIVDLQLGAVPQAGDHLIAEAHLLCLSQSLNILALTQLAFHVDNLLEGLQEVGGDHGDLMDLLQRDALADQFGNSKDVVRTELLDILQQLLHAHAVKLGQVQMMSTDFQRTDALQQSLLQIGADVHDLAGGLHLSAQLIGCGGELVEGEAGQLGNNVVQLGLESSVGVGNLDVLQGHTNSDLGSHAGNGITGSLGSQSGRAGNAGVDLDQIVLRGVRIQSKLDVAAAFNLQLLDELDGGVVQHLLVFLAQGHDGSDNAGVTGMHADGINVLHAADGDGMVVGVTHDLELDFLVALDGLLDQNLMHGRQIEGIDADLHQLLIVVSKAATGAAQGKGRAQNNGIADAVCSFLGFFQRIGNLGGDDRLADGFAHFLKQLTVLSTLDGSAGGAQQLDAAFLQNALLLQLHSQVQAGLAAQAGDDGVRALVTDDLSQSLYGFLQ